MRLFKEKSAFIMSNPFGWKLSLTSFILFSLLASLLLAGPLHAQWAVTYKGDDDPQTTDYANSVRQTSDGGYIVAGATGVAGVPAPTVQCWVMKLDAGGHVQ